MSASGSFSGGASATAAAAEAATYCGLALPPGSPPDSATHLHKVYADAPAAGPGAAAFCLYVGDIQASMDRAQLAALGVTHVINCCTASCGRTPADWAPFPDAFTYGLVHSNDSFWAGTMSPADIAAQDPSSQWHAVMLLLRECRAAGGSALVHCHWGINRSVTTAAVFLALSGAAPSFEEAVATIKGARSQAGPLPEYLAWGAAYCARHKRLA